MSLIPANQPRYEEMNEVMKLFVQGRKPFQIAKELGIRKIDVDSHIEEWRKSSVGQDLWKDRVDELISSMDEHYGMLIQKAYEIIEEVDQLVGEEEESAVKRGRHTMTRSQMLSQKLGAIKAIADLEAKRIDILQKSGLLEAADMGEALVEMEENKRMLLTILEEELCPSCRVKVMTRIAEHMQGEVVTIND